MKEDSSSASPRPQVQDGTPSPRERAIADYAAQEARTLAMTQCVEMAGNVGRQFCGGDGYVMGGPAAIVATICAALRALANAPATVSEGEEQGSTRSGEEAVKAARRLLDKDNAFSSTPQRLVSDVELVARTILSSYESAVAQEARSSSARIAVLEEALRIARLHAPLIKLAPERRHTIAVLDAALSNQGRL